MLIRDDDDRLPSGAMIRAARGLIGIGPTELAEAVGVSRKTIFEIERGAVQPADERRSRNLRRIKEYFVGGHGVVFLFDDAELGEGVRLRRSMT